MYNFTITVMNAPIVMELFQKAFPTSKPTGNDYEFSLSGESAPNPSDLAKYGASITNAQEMVLRDVKLKNVPVASVGAYAGPKRGRKPKVQEVSPVAENASNEAETAPATV